MQAPTALPKRFPCWCRAIYSWGGESKRDLGFIEGDLIECLNAGDGSWWMGRLKRDRRMHGLFPSNFVQVLDESFQPSRTGSPMPVGDSITSRRSSPAGSTAIASPQKAKSVFRKPFQAYAATGSPSSETAGRETASPSPSKSAGKHRPYASMKRSTPATVTPSPTPPSFGPSQARSRSPAPPSGIPLSRTPSPMPPPHGYRQYHSRSPAPYALSTQYPRPESPNALENGQGLTRAVSPIPHSHQFRSVSPAPNHEEITSSPPPAPPPHRSTYGDGSMLYEDASSHTVTHVDMRNGYYTPRSASPGPAVPEHSGFTPSPLRDAMDDVISSLNDMRMSGRSPSPTPQPAKNPSSIWSPEAFDEVYNTSTRRVRPQSSFTLSRMEEAGNKAQEEREEQPALYKPRQTGPPQLSNFVERMEQRLRAANQANGTIGTETSTPLPRRSPYMPRTQSSYEESEANFGTVNPNRDLKSRKSAYELGRGAPRRTFTTKSSVTTASSTAQSTSTNGSNSTQMTSQSIMSGYSAGGFSATSAGSLARRKFGLGGSIRAAERPSSTLRPQSAFGNRSRVEDVRSETAFTGLSYHSSQNSSRPGTACSELDWSTLQYQANGDLGGLTTPKNKKPGFFKKMLESAKTGAASARSTISTSSGTARARPGTPGNNKTANGITGFGGGTAAGSPARASENARDMGLGGGRGSSISGGNDWMQVRRDVNRSNSLSHIECTERAERCQMQDIPVMTSIDVLNETAEGDEASDGLPIAPEDAASFGSLNLSMVDKNTRFLGNLPFGITPQSLAQSYICRPYRSDVQRLRAIFVWVAERIAWEEDFDGGIDTLRVLETKKGCAQEVAVLIVEMCATVGLHAEVIRGYLKVPGEVTDVDSAARPNHWWNAVILDGEWRIMDASLASPTNPKRGLYSSTSNNVAEQWWFLARPLEICYTHVPLLPEQQHIVPSLPHEVLMMLPCVCPPYFRHGLNMAQFDNIMLHLENLEQAHIKFDVPDDIECVAEVEVRAYARDADGDFFESGDMVYKRALAQADWVHGRKRYTVKALLPGDEGQGVLRVYAGKKGLMHSIKSNPHSLAFALPITHTGQNPPYDFVIRHPTPHAARHDLYVVQPQCCRLAVQNTYVFAVRQHPSSLSSTPYPPEQNGTGPSRPGSAMGIMRPASAMSMISTTTSVSGTSGSSYSNPSQQGGPNSNSINNASGAQVQQREKPAKLAIQAPSGKILRLMRKSEASVGRAGSAEESMGSTWETIIKIGERGVWRGLVLADRSARWCVFAEWECL